MYKIIYKKENGDVIERVRNTLPDTKIGETTGMGWLVVDVLYAFKDGYYSASEYHRLVAKQRKPLHFKRRAFEFAKKYKDVAIIILTYFITKSVV